jgi:hypothetical protein
MFAILPPTVMRAGWIHRQGPGDKDTGRRHGRALVYSTDPFDQEPDDP